MTDIKSTAARSRNMSAIRSRDTKPELYLRKLLFSQGFRYRKNAKSVLGHPDIFLAKYHTAIFVHGCFWHRHHNCKYAYMPKSRTDFWNKKFNDNVKRDSIVKEKLIKQRTKHLVVWECTVKRMIQDEEYEKEMLKQIKAFLLGDSIECEL